MSKKTLFAACVAAMCAVNASAFDFSSLTSVLGSSSSNNTISSIINAVVGSSDIDVSSLAGTWKYKAPAVAFESENLLTQAGGVAAATTIENKLSPYYKKAGVSSMVLTIDSDGSFTIKLKKASLSGTITKLDSGKFRFVFKALGGSIQTLTADAYVKKGTTLDVTFNASKLATILSTMATLSGNSTVSAASSLLNSYDGIYAGFKFTSK